MARRREASDRLEIENGIHYLQERMYVCVCLAVTAQEVGAAISGGAHTREAVTRSCRAGGDCGACHGMIEDMVEDHLEGCLEACAAREESGPLPMPARADAPLVAAESLVRATRAA